jgi:hypothetical protein
VAWLPAESANGPLHYTVVLDGRELKTPPGVYSMHFDPHGLSSGKHKVQVLATDIFGQSTLTPQFPLLIDGSPPTVKLGRVRGNTAVVVRVGDPNSGVAAKATSVSFGDGTRAKGRKLFRHSYAHAGVYQVIVNVRDQLGNKATVRKLVSVR